MVVAEKTGVSTEEQLEIPARRWFGYLHEIDAMQREEDRRMKEMQRRSRSRGRGRG